MILLSLLFPVSGFLMLRFPEEIYDLTECEYAVYIPVVEVLSTDTETPMTIDITLESTDFFAYGNVKVR